MARTMREPAPSLAPHLRRLLDLLDRDAPAEDFGALLAAARGEGLRPPALDTLEGAAQTALRIRRTLHQHRRREAELSALFDTAGDLAALRELDAVLRSIVRRARTLLGTDTAYLTLPDEAAGDTYMRVTDGSVSPVFQNLRLELGEGLGGLVAQTARPYATADYPTDSRFRHTSNIDNGVSEEGLVAILGVPLLLGSDAAEGGKVIGVLFAADRSPRSFSPEEVALLGSLAAHAAIAIDTAHAIENARRALAELAEANAVIREHSAAMQRAEEAHDRLSDLVLGGGDIADVAAAVASLFRGPITIHDPEGRTLAAVGGTGGGAYRGAAAAPFATRAAEESRAAGRAVYRDGRWVCAVLAGAQLLGSLVLHERAELSDPDRRLFERAGVVTALLLLLRRSVAETENRVRGELVADLLAAPDRDPDGLVARGHRLGLDLTRPLLVLAAEAPAESRARLAAAAPQYLFGGEGIGAEHGQRVVLLLPYEGTEPGTAARAAAADLSHRLGVPVTVAGAGPAAGPPELAVAHAEAVRCLRALHILGRTGEGACAAELGFLGVLLGDSHDVDGFVRAALGALLAYDRRRGTELVRTLGAYFASGGSLTRTKDVLHVHVNTVVQRLDRIGALLGKDWNSPERALELQLALRLHQLAEGSPDSPPAAES
ncbi:GAF domain-containing protein [Streptomyces albus]|uniref:GAF domain-containing protein n=2 Tax=Streptomyces TaxID=1883 RepID=A0A0B5ESY4_STRA4|nr:GAF domain-containing protein [Streptomyces albus]AOU76152.1 GAF domain-containing protein [Streptomyces albus]AYN31943.1 GAF domain-containing protein [Streptomyces albus]